MEATVTVQRHKMLLWRRAEADGATLDEAAERACDTLRAFGSLPRAWQPRYLTARRKADARACDGWGYEAFRDELARRSARDGSGAPAGLGYNLGLFSSLDDDESCGYGLTVGVTDRLFLNVLVVRLPAPGTYTGDYPARAVEAAFRAAAASFGPFWGAVINEACARADPSLPPARPVGQERRVGSVHWLNYWDEGVVADVGAARVDDLLRALPGASFDGRVLRLRERPLDATDPADIELLHEANGILFG